MEWRNRLEIGLITKKYSMKRWWIKSISLSLHPQNANTNSLIKIIISNGNKN